MKLSLKVGTTSKTINIFLQDSSSATGAGLTGLVFNSSGLTAYYALPRAAATSITLATLAAVTSAYSSGGFKEIDATNMPGWYRFDIPDAALASGTFTSIHFKGATNLAPLPIEIELTAWDNQDSVRGGLTSLPNAAAEASGGLYTRGSGAGQINQPANGLIDINTLRWNGTAVSAPATAGIPDINVKNYNNVAATTDANNLPKVDVEDWKGAVAPAMTGDAFARLGVPNLGTVSADILDSENTINSNIASLSTTVTAIKAKTDNLKIKTNTALFNFAWLMIDSTDHITPKTGLTVACQRSIDGAAFANCATAAATEIANGAYKVNLAASDLNGTIIILKFTATGADQRTIIIATEP